MYKRALVHALYLGLSLLFATRFFSLTRLTSHAITDGDPAAAVSLVRELGVDVIAVHGAAAHAGNPLWDFFSQQDWTRVVKFPNDEFVVMVKR